MLYIALIKCSFSKVGKVNRKFIVVLHLFISLFTFEDFTNVLLVTDGIWPTKLSSSVMCSIASGDFINVTMQNMISELKYQIDVS